MIFNTAVQDEIHGHVLFLLFKHVVYLFADYQYLEMPYNLIMFLLKFCEFHKINKSAMIYKCILKVYNAYIIFLKTFWGCHICFHLRIVLCSYCNREQYYIFLKECLINVYFLAEYVISALHSFYKERMSIKCILF